MRAITVLDILEDTASRLPDKIFLWDEFGKITYGQYRTEAVRFGYALHRELEGLRRRPVILFMEKGCRCAVCLTGILYSGNFYVVMDTKTPIDRLESTLEALSNAIVVTTLAELKTLRKIGFSGNALIFEELMENWQDDSAEETVMKLKEDILDTDLMYVLFTSGSTGTPKGVAAMHRSVVDYIESSIEGIGIEENDVIGNQGPFYTDIPLRDVFMAMKAGATTCITPQRFFMSPKKLLQYLDEHHVTKLMWVPTAYRLISQFDALEKVRPSEIKKLLFVGEALPIPVYRYWRRHYPNADYRQLYGPSEITGVCTYYRITRDYKDGETIPIGRPFPNTGILLLDDNDKLIERTDTEKTGEICVRGTCITAGYYNDPEKTAKVFVQDPTITAYPSLIYRTGDLARYNEQGDMVFISRKDYQVKHGGRRIELGEVEAAFQSVAGIKAACCVQDRRADTLVLYYIGEISEDDIPLAVREKLPKYMIPALYHKMDELPILPNGKLDRKTLDRWANG